MKKITVIGDIMVEPPLLQQCKTETGYDFNPTFAPLKKMISSADYAIGNLETPLAGEDAVYTNRIVSFNAPDCVADAVKNMGIDAVTIANNHALDRKLEGLCHTIDVLDMVGLAHTGCYKPGETEKNRIHYFTVGDTRVALISYTYSTNHTINGEMLQGDNLRCVNYLRQYDEGGTYLPYPQYYYDTVKYVGKLLGRKLLWEEEVQLQDAMGMFVGGYDDNFDKEKTDKNLLAVEADYKEARKNADVVLFAPHIGGQFNIRTGKYSEYVMQKAADMGFDAIVGAHSHTTQKAELKGNCKTFFSLGNVTMVPSTFYSVPSCLPNYGLAVHFYVEGKKIQKTTFSVFKMIEPVDEPLRVVPISDLVNELDGEIDKDMLRDEVQKIYERVTGTQAENFEIKEEYDIF